jgi:hypothetical protein
MQASVGVTLDSVDLVLERAKPPRSGPICNKISVPPEPIVEITDNRIQVGEKIGDGTSKCAVFAPLI